MTEHSEAPRERRFHLIGGVPCLAWARGEGPSRVTNFGDEIGPIVISRIVGLPTGERVASPAGPRVLSVGSVLQYASRSDIVWGSGVNGKLRRHRLPDTLDVRAVRGPLTRAYVLSQGIWTPEVYGDPALLIGGLMPELASVARGDDVVVIPNLNEMDRFAAHPGYRSPVDDPLSVIRAIAGAGFVTGTSLHALIVADALGIPNRGILSDVEHPFKYLDYYAGTGRAGATLARSVEDALAMGPVEPATVDLDALRAAFPADLWGGAAPQRILPTARTYVEFRNASIAQRARVREEIGWDVSETQARALTRLEQFCDSTPIDGITREDAEATGVSLRHLRERDAHREIPLSVVIPTHNVAPWVRETMRSVLAQDVPGMEVIVVDDHSTDGTKEILAELAETHPELRLVHAVTYGGGSARNTGVDHARGKYLVFCDGDDLVPDGAYRAMVESLEASGSDIVFGDYLKFSPTDTWHPTASMRGYSQPVQGADIASVPTLLYSRPCWNKAFSRAFWETRGIRFPDVPRSNDIVPMTKAYLWARKVDVIENVVYLYRERPGATSMTSQAAGAASVASYLTQEAECAQLVIGAHTPRLSLVHSDLIFDRDGFVHLAKFLRHWQPGGIGDDVVVAAAKRLLDLTTPARAGLDPLKVRTVMFVAEGRLRAAAAAAHLAGGIAEGDGVARLQHVAHLLEALGGRADVQEAERIEVEKRVMVALDEEAGDTSSAAAWQAAAGAARRFFGPSALRYIPELHGLPEATPEDIRAIAEARARTASAVVGVSGGRRLRLSGTSMLGEGDVTPVLYDPIRAAVIAARDVTWGQGEGQFEWDAVFEVSDLPLHDAVLPALRSPGGSLTRVAFTGDLPEYVSRDDLLYEGVGRTLLVTRRRHWVVRAGRRAAIITRDRSRGVLHRLRGA